MYKLVKRSFDLFASGIALIVLSPVWLIAILGIEINDPGPVFYMAPRIGRDNRQFSMFKFRSMRVAKEQQIQTLRPEEDRIFPWGRILRRLKIDELPQLLNIFLGDMAIIGPRPVATSQFDLFRAGRFDETKSVRPGLSGPAALYDYIYGDQFEDSDEQQYREKVLPTRQELELVYVKKQSLRFDLKMIVWTVECILYSAAGKTPEKIYDRLVAWAKESASGTDSR